MIARSQARRPLARALGLVALALAWLVGCGDEAGRWVERAAADSEAADTALATGDHAEAEARLEALLSRGVPDDVAEEDARVVRQDAYDRLAEIALARGELERAAERVEEGLSLGEREDVFTANLLSTRGRIHEAAGRDAEAARDYHRALRIHEGLLDEALGGGGGSPDEDAPRSEAE